MHEAVTDDVDVDMVSGAENTKMRARDASVTLARARQQLVDFSHFQSSFLLVVLGPYLIFEY